MISPAPRRSARSPWLCLAAVLALAIGPGAGPRAGRAAPDPSANRAAFRINSPVSAAEPKRYPAPGAAAVAPPPTTAAPSVGAIDGDGASLPVTRDQVLKNLATAALFALVSLAPAAVLMLTAFVRINVVLVLLRQALGSPQVPGNQVLTALALLLTALVMRPVGEVVYTRSLEPYFHHKKDWSEAYRDGSRPVKAFMVDQIERTGHQKYLWAIHDESTPPGRDDPKCGDDFSLGVVATAFLLSELTTALVIGFSLYLPFLVVDLVVASVLAAMGLFMLPPSLVATPLKLILFVLVDGWLLVGVKLLQTFGPISASP